MSYIDPASGGNSRVLELVVQGHYLTDVHSWISGHRHSEASVSTGYGGPWRRVATAAQDADYGDLLSLIERLKAEASRRGVALFVFNSGDVVDGTGLSNLTPVNGQNLTPLLQALPFDAVAVGNHELYESATVGNLVKNPPGTRFHTHVYQIFKYSLNPEPIKRR